MRVPVVCMYEIYVSCVRADPRVGAPQSSAPPSPADGGTDVSLLPLLPSSGEGIPQA